MIKKAEGENTGESLKHLENVPQNIIYMGDRAYGTPTGLARAREHDRYFIVRFTWNNLPLFETRECREYVRPEKKLRGMKCGEILEFTAWAKGKNTDPFPLRIVVVRKDKKSAEKALLQSTYESKRKGFTPQNITLFMAQFITLATNLSTTDCAKELIAEAYRWRWQIEREFRRFKSTTYIRKLVNQKDSTVEVYILASLVAWLLS
ncbi:MAG: transposase [Candidatus Latescibacteria bacterium]|nr:transposase [Candidatus Latescibacterota bacterium]